MTSPRVSAIVPNYNHAQYLPRCLDALLQQSVPAFEVIALDDCSTDTSADVLADYQRRYPLLRIHRNDRNAGVCATLNTGLAMARGEYVGFYAADDEVFPGLFERSMPWLARHPEAGFVSGMCRWKCHATGMSWVYGSTMPRQAGYLSIQELVRLGRAGRLQVAAQPAIYRKDALIEAGGWRPELRWHTDWFGTWAVGFRHGICHIPEVLSVFNLYPNSYYASAKSRAERRETLDRLLDLLESDRYADVARPVRDSGLLGGFGWSMLRVIAGRRGHWRFLNPAFFHLLGRRSAEIVGRRYFPAWLARACLRAFYAGR